MFLWKSIWPKHNIKMLNRHEVFCPQYYSNTRHAEDVYCTFDFTLSTFLFNIFASPRPSMVDYDMCYTQYFFENTRPKGANKTITGILSGTFWTLSNHFKILQIITNLSQRCPGLDEAHSLTPLL